ncbi:MAG: hypothetical protein HOH14_12250 [Gammaproteobacteria bacterium]|jgi:hypothetical protein|nr:hypothetical protein [Gammaproteobacteria bacterium]
MNKTFVILACHRSASSLVAKALHEAGVHMGDDLLSGLPDNPEGHFEDMDFLKKNVEILGGDNWKDVNKSLNDADTQALIESKNNKPLWGWKDPRTALTIDKYYQHLEDPVVVSLFRKPELVAKSMAARGDIDEEEALQLAKAYNKKIIDFLSKNFL